MSKICGDSCIPEEEHGDGHTTLAAHSSPQPIVVDGHEEEGTVISTQLEIEHVRIS